MSLKPAHTPRKISPQTARRLLILAEILLLLGAIVLFVILAGPHQTIRCERTAGFTAGSTVDCQVTRRLFNLVQYDQIDLPGALFANLGESCEPSGCTYALQMFTSTQGFIPIEPYRQYSEHHATLMDMINDFMQAADSPSIEIAYQLNTINVLVFVAAIAVLVGLLVITIRGKR